MDSQDVCRDFPEAFILPEIEASGTPHRASCSLTMQRSHFPRSLDASLSVRQPVKLVCCEMVITVSVPSYGHLGMILLGRIPSERRRSYHFEAGSRHQIDNGQVNATMMFLKQQTIMIEKFRCSGVP